MVVNIYLSNKLKKVEIYEINKRNSSANLKERSLLALVSKIHDAQEYYDFSKYFPWDIITARVDGIHSWGRQGYGYDNDSWSYGYDVESTAWFNMDALEYVGKVRVSNQRGTGYDDD